MLGNAETAAASGDGEARRSAAIAMMKPGSQ
jgi:hypothetical protein